MAPLAITDGGMETALLFHEGPRPSTLSHAELDEMDELDDGDPVALARANASLRERLPSVGLLGGCCGTDHRHVAEIITAWHR